MKNAAFIRFLFTFLAIGLFSCEQNLMYEDFEEESNIQSKTSELNVVSLDEIPEISEFLKSSINKDLFSKASNEGTPIINTEKIIKVTDSLKRTNYSFSFMLPDQKRNKRTRLYNLMVGVDSLGRMSNPVVLRLTPKKKHIDEWVENDLDFAYFKGKVALHKFTDYFSANPFSKTDEVCPPEFDQNGDPIVCVEDEVNNTGSGGSSGDGSYVPAGGGSDGVTACTYSYYWSPCGGSNQYDTHGADICGGNGEGAGWVLEVECPTYSTTVIFLKEGKNIDCPGCEAGPSGGLAINTFARSVIKLDGLLDGIDYDLSNSELTWLNIETQVAYDINQFLKREGASTTNLELAKWALNVHMIPEVLCGLGHDCVKSIKVMADGLRKFHGADGALMAQYFDSLISDFDSFTLGELTEFHNVAKAVTVEFNKLMFKNITGAFAKGLKPILEIALLEVGATVAVKLLQKIPISWVYRGTRLNNAVKSATQVGEAGAQAHVRVVTTSSPVTRARELFNTLTKHAISTSTNAEGTIVATMGNGNYITFRTVSSSGFPATINFNFQQILGTNNFVVKFAKL